MAAAARTKHTNSPRGFQPNKGKPKDKAEKHGLFPLNSPKNPQNHIVAIHGLGGDAFATWTDRHGHMWLRDMLPGDLPNSKVWTYGYDSAFAWSDSVSGITDFARDLLERLLDVQDSTQGKERPFVFVCHSLGGIVIKKALVLATLSPAYESVLRNISAIIFMGTPHKGSRVSSYVTPLTRIINSILPGSPLRSDLIENLKALSRNLSEVSEMSVQPLSQIPIASFYEQKKMKGINSLVVEPASAILSMVNERAIPINANHRDMVRFSPDEPEKYRPVKYVIKSFVSKIEADQLQNPKVQEYLQKLYCVDYENQLTVSMQPYPGTGNWLFDKSTFHKWAQVTSSSIFWLRGAAGFGKTVIARSVVENLKLRTNRVEGLSPLGSSIVLHYFFRNEKTETLSQKSFLRSILHQILLEFPQLWSVVDFSWAKAKAAVGGSKKQSDFTSDGLWDALESALSMPALENAVLVVDALDELGSWELMSMSQKLVEMVHSLNRGQRPPNIKVLVCSRLHSSLEKTFHGKGVYILDMDRVQTSRDLETFLAAVVREFGRENNFPDSAILKIQNRILVGADGMFLWAHLAWEHFKQGVHVWSQAKITSQLNTLGQLPRGLEKLYMRLILSIDENARAELEPAFMLICGAARPLGCDELGEILSIESWHRRASDVQTPFSMEATLIKLCPNLFKIDLDGMVSFVHLSLKDFLLETLLHIDATIVHQYIARKCLRYLEFEDFKRDVVVDKARSFDAGCLLRERYLLYDYCTAYLKYHLEHVQYSDQLWIKYSKIVQNRQTFHAIAEPDHKHIWGGGHASDFPFPNFYAETPLRHVLRLRASDLIRAMVEEGYDVNERVISGRDTSFTALHQYIRDPSMASLLLQVGADPNAEDSLSRTALHLAILYDRTELVTKLLAHPNIDVNAKDVQGDTPLHYQAAIGAVPTLLFDRRVDVSNENKSGITPMARSAVWGDETTFRHFVDSPNFDCDQHNGTISPLICAAQQDWRDLTLHLVKRVADANKHRGHDGKSIVHWAVINEWDDVLQEALMKAKANVNAMDHSGKTALHYAAQLGLFKTIRLLLQYGASARIQDAVGRTALHTAAVEGFADTLQPLILDSDFNPDDSDKQNRSLIHWAASCDWGHIMMTVLEIPGINPKKRDHHGRTASHVASLCGCPNVLRRLIDYDVFEPTETDAFGNTALHLAARGQSLTAVEVLLPFFDFQKHRLNCWGQTARDVAFLYRAKDIENTLAKAGLRFQAKTSKTRELDDVSELSQDRNQYLVYTQTPSHLALMKFSQNYDREASPVREDEYGTNHD